MKRSLQLAARAMFLGAFLSTSDATAQEVCSFETLVPATTDNESQFGGALEIDGDWLFVGSPEADLNGIESAGMVSIYLRSGGNWLLQQELFPGEIQKRFFKFGTALDCANGVLVVGAPGESDFQMDVNSRGAVYVYAWEGTSWELDTKLLASDFGRGDGFGSSVCTDGSVIVAGAPRWDALVADVGSAYAFEVQGTGWVEFEQLSSPSMTTNELFGSKLALAGTDLAITSPNTLCPVGSCASGSVAIFRRNGDTFDFIQQLNADPLTSGGFASAIDADGPLLIVANDFESGTLAAAGSVYVFELQPDQTWAQRQVIEPQSPVVLGRFGKSVAIDDRTILVGSELGGSVQSGSVVVHEELGGSWIQTSEYEDTTYAFGDQFSWRVALDGSLAAVGALLGPDVFTGIRTGQCIALSLDGSLCPTLTGSNIAHSLSLGGTLTLNLDLDDTEAGALYWIVGTASGTTPGFPVGALLLPINLDSYFFSVLVPGPGVPLTGQVGALDASASAVAQLIIPAGTNPSLAGITLHHAAIVYSLGPLTFSHISNDVQLRLFP